MMMGCFVGSVGDVLGVSWGCVGYVLWMVLGLFGIIFQGFLCEYFQAKQHNNLFHLFLIVFFLSWFVYVAVVCSRN
jgi:uncharacterized membrane protein YeaQ/YmgE (transglycosylase-associated protein family)